MENNQKELLKQAGYSDKSIKYVLEKIGVGVIKNTVSKTTYDE